MIDHHLQTDPAYLEAWHALCDCMSAFDATEDTWCESIRHVCNLPHRSKGDDGHIYYKVAIANFIEAASVGGFEYWFLMTMGNPTQAARAHSLINFLQHEAHAILQESSNQK